MIPVEAVVAATKVLYADKMSNHSGDNAPQIIDACEVVVKKILEAAAPHMLAAAFDEAAEAWAEAASWSDSKPSPEQVQRWLRSRANTYRPTDAV